MCFRTRSLRSALSLYRPLLQSIAPARRAGPRSWRPRIKPTWTARRQRDEEAYRADSTTWPHPYPDATASERRSCIERRAWFFRPGSVHAPCRPPRSTRGPLLGHLASARASGVLCICKMFWKPGWTSPCRLTPGLPPTMIMILTTALPHRTRVRMQVLPAYQLQGLCVEFGRGGFTVPGMSLL